MKQSRIFNKISHIIFAFRTVFGLLRL